MSLSAPDVGVSEKVVDLRYCVGDASGIFTASSPHSRLSMAAAEALDVIRNCSSPRCVAGKASFSSYSFRDTGMMKDISRTALSVATWFVSVGMLLIS